MVFRQDFEPRTKKDDFGDGKIEDTMSPVSQDDDDDEDAVVSKTSTAATVTTAASTINSITSGVTLSGELAMEIDSLNKMSRRPRDDSGNDIFVRTPLPSFSTIIGGNAVVTTTTCSNDASLLSVLHSTSVSDLSQHDHDHDHHLMLDDQRSEKHDGQHDATSTHSRRSSVDTGGLIIHESLPGSRHASPAVSRRTSVDHGSILQHLNDRRSSVDHSVISGSGICMMTDDHHGSEAELSDLTHHHHHHLSLPFISHHDPSAGDGCRMTGSDPPTPANGLHPLCSMMDPMNRQYHSMPSSPRPLSSAISALESLASCVEKASNPTIPDDLMSLTVKSTGAGLMDQLTIQADMDTSTNVTFTDHQPILSLSPVKRNQLEMEKPPAATTTTSATLPPPATHSGVSQDSSSSTSHFLSDLESVLGDSADFSFASSLKTPEKLFHAIPPMSMSKKVMVQPPSMSSRPSTNATNEVRIDFLGALEKNEMVSGALLMLLGLLIGYTKKS